MDSCPLLFLGKNFLGGRGANEFASGALAYCSRTGCLQIIKVEISLQKNVKVIKTEERKLLWFIKNFFFTFWYKCCLSTMFNSLLPLVPYSQIHSSWMRYPKYIDFIEFFSLLSPIFILSYLQSPH